MNSVTSRHVQFTHFIDNIRNLRNIWVHRSFDLKTTNLRQLLHTTFIQPFHARIHVRIQKGFQKFFEKPLDLGP